MSVTVKKKNMKYLVLAAFLFLMLLVIYGFNLSFRLEIVVKLLIISTIFMTCPKMDFGIARVPIILVIGLFIVSLSGVVPDSKSFSRTAMIIALLLLLFPTRQKWIVVLIVIIPLWFLHDTTGSRTLLATLGLFTAQLIFLRYFDRPFLILIFVLAYPIGMYAIGYSFIFADGLLHASASNLARSTLVYALLDNIWSFPTGYPDASTYTNHLRISAQNLYSDEYNDPHNMLLSAIVWGGLPLLLIVVFSFSFGIYRTVLENSSHPGTILAASALAVNVSTQTLSFVNVLAFLFLAVYISRGNNRSSRAQLTRGGDQSTGSLPKQWNAVR